MKYEYKGIHANSINDLGGLASQYGEFGWRVVGTHCTGSGMIHYALLEKPVLGSIPPATE